MSGQSRLNIAIALWVIVSVGLIIIGVARYSSEPRIPILDMVNYLIIGMGVICLLLTPVMMRVGKRTTARREEMNEMLEDYRRRKNRP